MTEAEYREFIELEKDGKAKDLFGSAYPKARADAEEYRRSLDVKAAATNGGKTSGENAQLVNGLERSVSNGDNAISLAIMQEGNARQAGQTALATQLASCCCENKQLIGDLKYTIATEDCATRQAIADNARAVIDNCNANFRSMMDYFTQDKIATLTAENQSLKFAASQAAQNAYLVGELRPCPVPAYTVPNPYCCNTYYGGCGNAIGVF